MVLSSHRRRDGSGAGTDRTHASSKNTSRLNSGNDSCGASIAGWGAGFATSWLDACQAACRELCLCFFFHSGFIPKQPETAK